MNCVKTTFQSQALTSRKAALSSMSKYLSRPSVHRINIKFRKSSFQEDCATVRVVVKEHCEKIQRERAGQLLYLAEDNSKSKRNIFMVSPRPDHKWLALKRSCRNKNHSDFGVPSPATPFTLGMRDVSRSHNWQVEVKTICHSS